MRAVFAQLRGLSGVSDEQRLDFALRLLDIWSQVKQHRSAWNSGVWDSLLMLSDTFVSRLDNNRDCVLNLSRPNKLGATTRERIQSIKVDLNNNGIDTVFSWTCDE